jgi:Holliday junction resolvase RusA-like endonuclease
MASLHYGLPPPKKSGKITSPPDLDNLIKFVLDALNGKLYADDSQIVRFRNVDKNFDDSNGGAGFTVVHLSVIE